MKTYEKHCLHQIVSQTKWETSAKSLQRSRCDWWSNLYQAYKEVNCEHMPCTSAEVDATDDLTNIKLTKKWTVTVNTCVISQQK